MQLWNDFLTWFNSPDGTSVLVNGIVPFLAIVVAGFIAAAIGRSSTKRLIALNDRENRVSAIATMIGAARKAAVWNTLSVPEQQHAEHVASEADVRVRLLGVTGSGLAADWAAHEFASMKRNSVSFSFQAEQSLIEFRDRMVTWQSKPGRARKLFKNDLDVWAYEDSQTANNVVAQQQEWAKAQVATQLDSTPNADTAPAIAPVPATPTPTPTPTPATLTTPPAPGATGAGSRIPATSVPVADASVAAPAPIAPFVPTPARPSTPSWISPTPKATGVQPFDAATTDQPSLVEPPMIRPLTPAPRTVENASLAPITPSFLDSVDDRGVESDSDIDRDAAETASYFVPMAANEVKNRISPLESDDQGRAV